MTLQIDLSPELEAKLRERAAAAGKDAATFALEAVREKLSEPQTFAEILAPVHEEFRERGLTEEAMTPIFEKLREEVWEARHGKKLGAS